MKKTSIRRGRTPSIRARVLTIALVPCFVFLLAGAGGAGYLIYDAVKTRNYFDLASQAQRAALPLIMSVEEERRLTLRNLASLGTFETELIRQRAATDQLVEPVRSTLAELNPVAPDSVRAAADQVTALMATELPRVRAAVDNNQINTNDAFTFYNTVVDHFIAGAQGVAQFAPDAESVHQIGVTTGPLLTAVDQMLRADALASANLAGGGLSQADFRGYQGLVSAYHLGLDRAMALTIPDVQAGYAQLKESPSWQRLVSVENALLGGGDQIPVSEDLWRSSAKEVGDQLMTMLTTQSRATMAAAVDRLDTTLTQSIIAGAVVLALAVAVFVFALRLSRRLIERLTRLRSETLDLAETGLPELVERIRSGADIAVEDSVRLHDHGRDEIGQVADAFNKAQRTAVSAAVQEAKTREGTNTVFLNIARRSQVIVHRQLKVLDEAERRQEDPELLEMLFQLDHLSTRARRNAENLIILGGGQPGRRWRNPVSLTELARGAAAETEDFARVKIAKLPRLAVNGPVVGDLVHLLAELVDNAASFSPPDSRVDVRGNVVGKGVVLEVEDQGVGIEHARTEAFNDMLSNPPDFGIMALSDEPRLGLFVVARLAARHGISVTLRDSPYGGTSAIVLIRTELLTDVPSDEQPAPPAPADPPSPPAPVSAPVEPAPVSSPVEPAPVSSTEIADQPVRASSAPDLTAFLQPLPAFPMVESQPGEDLFRPQRPVEESPAPAPKPRPQHRAPEPEQEPADAEPATGGGRPPLPQRRRQQNLAPPHAEPEPTWPDDESTDQTVEDTPDAARSRLSAFVLGTRRGREDPGPDLDDVNGNGVRNGQHRAE